MKKTCWKCGSPSQFDLCRACTGDWFIGFPEDTVDLRIPLFPKTFLSEHWERLATPNNGRSYSGCWLNGESVCCFDEPWDFPGAELFIDTMSQEPDPRDVEISP